MCICIIIWQSYMRVREFSEQELETATKSFSELLGNGSFGSVYKGIYAAAHSYCSESYEACEFTCAMLVLYILVKGRARVRRPAFN